MATKSKTHYDISFGLNQITACGKSLHGWNRYRPKSYSQNLEEVTCLNCLREIEKDKKM